METAIIIAGLVSNHYSTENKTLKWIGSLVWLGIAFGFWFASK